MILITIESLQENGFVVDLEDKKNNSLWLKKDIRNWSICYRIYHGKISEFIIESDGGYDHSGEFDISNFKYIEQINNLINSMLGGSYTTR
jgi:hypothetical protein